MTVALRPARPADAAALTQISLLSKQSNGYDDVFMAACRAELTITPAMIQSTSYWVAEVNGSPCGMVCLSHGDTEHSGNVSAFFVLPDNKRQGIGKLLWQQVLCECRNRSLDRVHLDADPGAVPFYQALGFKITKMVASGSIAGRDLPYMELDL